MTRCLSDVNQTETETSNMEIFSDNRHGSISRRHFTAVLTEYVLFTVKSRMPDYLLALDVEHVAELTLYPAKEVERGCAFYGKPENE